MNENINIDEHQSYPDSNQKIEVPTMKVIPLKKICMTIGELPTSYLETMTYYEMLVWFINYLRDNIIPTVNGNAEAVQEVQNVVMELQNYINNFKDSIDEDVEELEDYMNNYFNNLDVQEEINNKLDEMLEDGVLEQIIEQFINSTALWCYDTVADLKEATNLIEGSFAKTLGYYEVNDGGGATYKITDTESLTEYQEELESGLYATLIIKNEINILQFGAKRNVSEDSYTAFNKAINYPGYNVFIPAGNYYIASNLIASEPKKIYGEGKLIFTNALGNGLTVYDSIQLEGLYISCDSLFTGKVLVYDGENGTRTYPSTARFENLTINSNSDNQIECLFYFAPYSNYGIILRNLIIGERSEKRLTTYGFRCVTNRWANNIIIDKMLLDVLGTNIIPFSFISSDFGTYLSSGNVFENIRIQHRTDATYDRFFVFRKINNSVIRTCSIYDYLSNNVNYNPILYDNCGNITMFNCDNNMLQINAEYINPPASTYYNGYSSNLDKDLQTKNNLEAIDLTDHTVTQIVPILFPMNVGYLQYSDIELYTRVSSAGGTNGGGCKIINRCTSITTSNFYVKDLFILYNFYKFLPFIYKIKVCYEGLVVYVKGNNIVYAKYLGSNKPRIAINEVVKPVGESTTETLAVEDIGTLTGIPQTDTPKYFFGKNLIVDYSNAESI